MLHSLNTVSFCFAVLAILKHYKFGSQSCPKVYIPYTDVRPHSKLYYVFLWLYHSYGIGNLCLGGYIEPSSSIPYSGKFLLCSMSYRKNLAHSVSIYIWALLCACTHPWNLNLQNIYTIEEHTATAKFPAKRYQIAWAYMYVHVHFRAYNCTHWRLYICMHAHTYIT